MDASTGVEGLPPASEGPWRGAAIFFLKALHTAIFVFESLCVFAVLYAAITNRVSRWTVGAIGTIVLEGMILLFNRMQCPLRIWTERLGAARGSVTDIFLPRWLADRIFQIYTPLFLAGLAGIGFRRISRR